MLPANGSWREPGRCSKRPLLHGGRLSLSPQLGGAGGWHPGPLHCPRWGGGGACWSGNGPSAVVARGGAGAMRRHRLQGQWRVEVVLPAGHPPPHVYGGLLGRVIHSRCALAFWRLVIAS